MSGQGTYLEAPRSRHHVEPTGYAISQSRAEQQQILDQSLEAQIAIAGTAGAIQSEIEAETAA